MAVLAAEPKPNPPEVVPNPPEVPVPVPKPNPLDCVVVAVLIPNAVLPKPENNSVFGQSCPLAVSSSESETKKAGVASHNKQTNGWWGSSFTTSS